MHRGRGLQAGLVVLRPHPGPPVVRWHTIRIPFVFCLGQCGRWGRAKIAFKPPGMVTGQGVAVGGRQNGGRPLLGGETEAGGEARKSVSCQRPPEQDTKVLAGGGGWGRGGTKVDRWGTKDAWKKRGGGPAARKETRVSCG